MDPLEMLLNPDESEVEVFYYLFYHYDKVSWDIQSHVGDIECVHMIFKNGVPV